MRQIWITKAGPPEVLQVREAPDPEAGPGRVYAAELLTHADAAAGRAAWLKLEAQDGEVKTFSGCIMGSTTVGRYAAERLRD